VDSGPIEIRPTNIVSLVDDRIDIIRGDLLPEP